jgi:hypothetical protein
MTPQQFPTAQPLRAYLMRELVLDQQGQPMFDSDHDDDPDAIAAHWALMDSLEPTLVPICEGELVITSADDGEFLRQHVATELSESKNSIRAIFTPTTESTFPPKGPRMGDLMVIEIAAGTSLCWIVGPGHDDLPDVLTVPGERCLVLREDLGLILHDPTDPSSIPTANLQHAHRAKETTRAIN